MAIAQPYGFACRGGLNKNLSQFEMLSNPGWATELQNFEVQPDGGYRRINGYTLFEDSAATRPGGDSSILGIHPYALGVVVCVGDAIYYGEDGDTWIQVNYDVGHAGVVEGSITSSSELPRASQGQAQFALMHAGVNHVGNPYGSLTIATGSDAVAHFHISGTGAGRLFAYEELTTPAAGQYVELHDKHLCIVDTENAPSTVYWSATNDDRDFAGGGSGSATLMDNIVGIKSFRDNLYIFCENTIHRLENINVSANTQIVQVTNNLGCVSGYSIQELGGDLIFLAPDGFRTIAGTERLGDVELGSVSRAIQTIVENITDNIAQYRINSAVIRDKSQYRFFYNVDGGSSTSAKGILGTLTKNGMEWSEVKGIEVAALSSDYDTSSLEVYYHGDHSGYIYLHDTGSDFNGLSIDARYEGPNLDFGDVGTLKTLKYVSISVSPEGSVQPTLRVRYDYRDVTIPQPNDYVLDSIPAPAVFDTAVFGTDVFGATNDPMIRQTVEGSGHTANFLIYSNDTNSPYSINGLYINYDPSGRR